MQSILTLHLDFTQFHTYVTWIHSGFSKNVFMQIVLTTFPPYCLGWMNLSVLHFWVTWSHSFTVKLVVWNRLFYSRVFFSGNSHLWKSFPISVFHDAYNLQKQKCNVIHHLQSSWILFTYCSFSALLLIKVFSVPVPLCSWF